MAGRRARAPTTSISMKQAKAGAKAPSLHHGAGGGGHHRYRHEANAGRRHAGAALSEGEPDGLHVAFTSAVSPTPGAMTTSTQTAANPIRRSTATTPKRRRSCASPATRAGRGQRGNIGSESFPHYAVARIQGWEALGHDRASSAMTAAASTSKATRHWFPATPTATGTSTSGRSPGSAAARKRRPPSARAPRAASI